MVLTVLNNKGSSLIEILISIVLTAFVFGGLVQSSILVANQSMENLMRDEAVSIAEDRMSQARSMVFDILDSELADVTVVRDFRGITGFPFDTRRTVADIDTENKMVTVNVTWTRKGVVYNHNISTVVRKI